MTAQVINTSRLALKGIADSKDRFKLVPLNLSPWFNPDLLDRPLPEPVTRWKQSLIDADAILIACPEYGHSLPGVLKNAIDWVIGSGELYNKRVAITASVPIAERGLNGLAALHQTLSAVDAVIVFADTIVRGEDTQQQIEAMLATITN